MSIIQLAGTSGSGKSHCMRSAIDWLKSNLNGPVLVEEREKLLGYLYHQTGQLDKDVFVVGRYDSPTGGCDTIKEISQVYSLIEQQWESRRHVLYEGLFVMNMTRGPQLAAKVGKELNILQLTTPLSVCIKSIDLRRAERDKPALGNLKNTEGNYKRAVNYCGIMRDAGAKVYKVTRSQAFPKMLELLGAK